MLRKILLLSLLLLPCFVQAQPGFVTCVDSLYVNAYYSCYEPYQPQCGCDGVTYRNPCSAENKGGLVTSHNYRPGICDNFDFDFNPNPVDAFTVTSGSILRVYVNDNLVHQGAQNLEVYIFDIYNRIQYFRFLYITSNDNFGTGLGTPIDELNSDFFAKFERGIYLVVVTMNGEKKAKKIMKA